MVKSYRKTNKLKYLFIIPLCLVFLLGWELYYFGQKRVILVVKKYKSDKL